MYAMNVKNVMNMHEIDERLLCNHKYDTRKSTAF